MADDRHCPLHQDADPIRGWWGINVADQEDYLPPFQAVASRNWINRLGLKNDNQGVLATRPGIAESPKYEQNGLADTTGTTYPVRLLAKFYPDATIAAGSQVLRIHFTNFQRYNKGAGTWTTLEYEPIKTLGPVVFNGVGTDDMSASINFPIPNVTTDYLVKIDAEAVGNVTFTGAGLDDMTVSHDDSQLDGPTKYWVFIDGEGAPDTFSWSIDAGETFEEQEVPITGGAQLLMNGVSITFGATTGHSATNYWTFTVRPDKFKWSDDNGITFEAENVPITSEKQGLDEGVNILFTANTGHTLDDEWAFTLTVASGGLVDDLSVGAGAHPDGGYYPQWIIFDVPSGPWFCWIDPENGLYVYDGVEVKKVDIPRHNAAGNIGGALWLAQVDAMLIVSGCLEAAQSDIAWYSKAGSATVFSPDQGAGSWEVWGVDSRSKASPPKRVTGLAELGRNLIVFTEDMRYIWIGIGTYLQDRSIEPGAGCAWGNTICTWEGSIYWCGKDGVYEWSRGEPRRLHKEIWNNFQYIEWSTESGGVTTPNLQKFHSFIFEDQYWLNVQTSLHSGDYNNTNFVLDLGIRKEFGLNHWYILDIPMGPAFDSKGGLDLGALFFASPVDYGDVAPQYRTFRYGFDDSNPPPSGGSPQIFADIYTDGTPQVRTAHVIVCEWETGTLHYGDPLVGEEHQGVLIRFGITNAGGEYAGSFTHARVEYTILDGAETERLDFPTAEVADQEFHYLGIDEGKKNKSHFVKFKWQVSAINKRVHLKQCYGLFRPLPAALWIPR